MGHDPHLKLTRLECFSRAESEDIVRILDPLRKHFTKRFVSTDIYFWTLGTSAYLDAYEAHGDNAQKTNDIIASNFGKFYLKMFRVLQDYLGEPVTSPPSVNVPGFHIFEELNNLPIGVPYGGSIHKDSPHISSMFPFHHTSPITFTIMLEAPKNGAGLNYWDNDVVSNTTLPSNRFDNMSTELQKRLIKTVKTFKYKIGELVIFDGQTTHQIANMVATDQNDRRISIQGHGVLTDDGYIVYF